ncbi:MAG: hypothetical protein AAGB02_01880 [Pseudomonadota bacterium]
MMGFALSEEQIARCIGAACADELSRKFSHYTDFLTVASWGAETQIGPGGVLQDSAQRAACQSRVAALFGVEQNMLEVGDGALFADWARVIAKSQRQKMQQFQFKPAGRDKSEPTSQKHTADRLFQDAAAAANLFYGRRRLLSLVAPHSLMGFLIGVLTPNIQGIDAIDARRLTPDALSKALSFGDVLVATPTLWRYMIREGLSAPDNAMAVAFGEPMTADLAADMRKAGFGALRELYGTTEHGLIGWRDSPTEPFLLFDHWAEENTNLVLTTPNGEQASLVPMDKLDWLAERRFQLAGRRDNAVQIGAVNVFPDDVARFIRSHPAVENCDIRVGERSDMTKRLIANIELSPSAPPIDAAARDIDAWCRANLAQQERPRIYNFEKSRGKKNAPRRRP